MKSEIEIKHLAEERIDEFFLYLTDHISDNGKDNSSLFQPISRNNSSLPKGLTDSFKGGQSISIDQSGWRRVFVAVHKMSDIIGHIDLKSHPQNHTHHRALLGMGVHRDYRKMGLGKSLIETAVEWANNATAIESIDLWVLAGNRPAIQLYKKLGFQKIGEVEDMFRIDGNSLNYVMMTKKIR